MEEIINGRFGRLETKVIGGSKEVKRQGLFEGLLEEVERNFREQKELRDIKVQVENAAAITRNSRIDRMHQPINLIKVLKNDGVWDSHPLMPKHINGIYILGQRAKGQFEPSWEGKPIKQSKSSTVQQAPTKLTFTSIENQAKQEASDTIRQLADFYSVQLWSESESDATETLLQEATASWSKTGGKSKW